ncbi:BrnT family toxin [Skermanella mucosa]|nr:hypothetical protein [Skermanella mucosa]
MPGGVFDSPTLTVADDRKDYGEPLFIGMRKANEREQELYGPDLE